MLGFVVFPLLITFWQSGWNFLAEWLETPSGRHQAALPSLYLLSQFILFIIYLNQDRIYDYLVKEELKFFVVTVLQLHTFITALSYIVQWVSMWTLMDYYTSTDWLLMLVISITSIFAIIILTGNSYDLVCSPFVMSYDSVAYNTRIETPFIMDKVIQSLVILKKKMKKYVYYFRSVHGFHIL